MGAHFCQQAPPKEAKVVKHARLQDPNSSDTACVARYESIDTCDGRVWGMPSAFGRGQCLDCPNKAAPPSKRCESCQLAYQAGEPMAIEDINRLRAVLEDLVRTLPEAQRGDILSRLQQLTSRLSAGTIQQPIQLKLRGIVDVAAAGDRGAAKQEVAWLAANEWEQHKIWIVALRRLFA